MRLRRHNRSASPNEIDARPRIGRFAFQAHHSTDAPSGKALLTAPRKLLYHGQNMCAEHARLLKAYQQSMALFSLTLVAFEAAKATVSRDEFRRQAGYFEQACMRGDRARVELESDKVD